MSKQDKEAQQEFQGICHFCGWRTPWLRGEGSKQQLKAHYKAKHIPECAQHWIKKWGGISCLGCIDPIDSMAVLRGGRFCRGCGYDMSGWLAGVTAFASQYESRLRV